VVRDDAPRWIDLYLRPVGNEVRFTAETNGLAFGVVDVGFRAGLHAINAANAPPASEVPLTAMRRYAGVKSLMRRRSGKFLPIASR
jgi:hypothetical protein